MATGAIRRGGRGPGAGTGEQPKRRRLVFHRLAIPSKASKAVQARISLAIATIRTRSGSGRSPGVGGRTT
jgi:hypothetical protein